MRLVFTEQPQADLFGGLALHSRRQPGGRRPGVGYLGAGVKGIADADVDGAGQT